MGAAPSQEEVRRRNLGALLRFVHRHGAMSRAELTSALGLNRSTIGALTAELAAAGLVTEATPREAGRGGRAGRPSLVVSPRSEAVHAYAFSIEVDRVRAARIGLGGVVLDRRETVREPGQTGEEVVKPFATFVSELHPPPGHGSPGHGPAADRVRCIGCGVAISGRVRSADGTIGLAPPAESLAEPLRAALGEVLPSGPPVLTGAAADLAARAEHTRGVATACENIIYLYGDAGVTAGVIAGGRQVSGYGGVAGEVGHMVVRPGGWPCGCGSRGCWETAVGEQALLRAADRGGAGGREAVREVIDAASRGDSTAKAAVRQTADWLGFGVGNLVNIFNPELVIFGEMLRDIYLAAAAPLRSRLNSIGLAANLPHVRLRTPALGDDAPLIGAAELAFEGLLADPLDAATGAP